MNGLQSGMEKALYFISGVTISRAIIAKPCEISNAFLRSESDESVSEEGRCFVETIQVKFKI